MSHTPEKWWARGPLSEEEVSRVGGVPPQIVIARSDGEDNPEIVLVVAEFEHESDRDKAIACVNALAGVDDPAAQVARWKADAARYRKLIDIMDIDGVIDIGEAYLKLKAVGESPESSDWDAAIDAALAAKGGE